MNKIKRSICLLKTAFAILFREKKLLVFPLIATGLALVIAMFFLAPVALYPSGHSYFSAAHWHALAEMFTSNVGPAERHHQPMPVNQYGFMPFFSGHWWLAVLFTIVYFVSMFLATFCNVAFYHEIMQALNGNAVSIRRGFRFAETRWRAILWWSLFAGLVGYIIQTIEQRVGILGRLIAGLIGFAWSVACIFIIPTLVRDTETTNPLKLLRHSAGTLKRTWGELVVGFIGVELISLVVLVIIIASSLLTLLGLPIILALYHVNVLETMAVIMGLSLLGFIFATLISSISNLVNSVYRCALFIYATEGVIPEPFDKELLDSAWKVK